MEVVEMPILIKMLAERKLNNAIINIIDLLHTELIFSLGNHKNIKIRLYVMKSFK
jgi:hypothetical protein